MFVGTGKTLSLLCAALAWREAYVARLQLNSNTKSEGSQFMKETQETLDLAVGFGLTKASEAIPKIIYASRTHSQLSQAVSELKNTSYKPKVSILGSRDQMCINHDVTRLDDNNAKVYACRVKISSRSCMHYNNVESNKSNKEFKNEILDIEDMVQLGKKHSVCPYFMSRELRTDADLIFMPYNYVLDLKMRQTNSVDLKNAIILLDEAHNVEKICEEAASFELTTFDLANAQADCNECRNILEERNAPTGFDEGSTPESAVTMEDTMKLKEIFNKIEAVLMEPDLTPQNPKMVAGAEFLYNALKKQSIDASSVNSIIEAIDQCNTLLASQPNMGFKRKHFALPKISELLRTLFCYSDQPTNLNFEIGRFYKVVIRQEKTKPHQRGQINIWDKPPEDDAKKVFRTLSYWCFHAGVSMKEIMKQGTRSLILTSGTLSPLESFTSELDIPFPVTLQNPHVIGSNQIWAGIITKGPDGVELNSSYQKRSTAEYQNSLGTLLVNLSRSTPHGLLVFFPSYVLMDEMIKTWNQNGTLDRISHNKPHFAEPKDKRNLATQMEMFYDKINDPSFKGAVFFAVCRGKVSEGLDFANKNGRVVVITGLPYPPKMDAKVELKMQFLDQNVSKGKLSGRQWYSQQASRAVNQAVGRVIRHNKDYGAILLCDVRFTYPDAIARLPVWIKPHVKTYNDFGVAHRNLLLFFKHVENMFSPPKVKKISKYESKEPSRLESYHTEKASSSKGKLVAKRGVSVAPSFFNSHAANSLAAIKAVEGPQAKTSLFQSLSNSNVKEVINKDMLQKCQVSRNIIGSTNDVTKSKAKSKKLKLVSNRTKETLGKGNEEIKKQEECSSVTSLNRNSKQDMNGDDGRRMTEEKGSKSITDAKRYIITLRSVLTKEEYDKFAKILLNYTKKEEMPSLIKDLTLLFEKKPEQIHLFKGFENFIKKEKDKKLFDKAYDCLVARVSQNGDVLPSQIASVVPRKTKAEEGYSKNDGQAMEPASKKQKLSAARKFEATSNKAEIPISDFFPTLSDDSDDEESHRPTKCIICINDVRTPYQAPCGHIACGKCWYYHLKNEKDCPKCKARFNQRKLVKMKI